jgi:hypothetical protein
MQLTLEDIDLAAIGLSEWAEDADKEETAEDADKTQTPAIFIAIAEAAAIIETRIPDPSVVDLVVTGNFPASVVRRFGTPNQAEHFDTKRGAGEATAMTIPLDDRAAIVVPIGWFLDERDAGQAKPSLEMRNHLVAHEALHVALRQRGEQTHDVRSRLGQSVAHGQFVASAGVVSEEYRVQAALHAEGPNPYDNQDDLHDDLVAARAAIMDGITLRVPDEPIDRCMRTVMDALHILAIRLAYLAASMRKPDGSVPTAPPASMASDPLWLRLIGSAWPAFAAAMAAFPEASQPTTTEVINEAVLNLADILADWIKQTGFELRDTTDDQLYFAVLRHDF